MSSRTPKGTKIGLPEHPLASHLQGRGIIQEIQTHQFFEGPLPDPDTLERYKNADPSFPERIMKMAEAHNAADVKIKDRVSLANLIVPILGQFFTLALGGGGVIAAIYLAKSGFAGGSIAAIVASFAPIVISAFRGLRHNKPRGAPDGKLP
jgi:uncharacterized membrane protein